MIFQYMSLAGLAFGMFAGLIALFRPNAIANTLRLQPDPGRPGGYAEFRATFGGVFLMIHLTGFITVLHIKPTLSIFAVLPISMAWFGAAFARMASMFLDKAQNGEGGINRYWVILELVIGLLILSILAQLLSEI